MKMSFCVLFALSACVCCVSVYSIHFGPDSKSTALFLSPDSSPVPFPVLSPIGKADPAPSPVSDDGAPRPFFGALPPFSAGFFTITPTPSQISTPSTPIQEEEKHAAPVVVDGSSDENKEQQKASRLSLEALKKDRNFGWAVEGELGGMAKPQSNDDIANLLKVCGNKKILIVTLTEEKNEALKGWPEITDEAVTCLPESQIVWHHCPLTVEGLGMKLASSEKILEVIEKVKAARALGMTVIIHCDQGINRTGWVLINLLVKVWNKSEFGDVRSAVWNRPYVLELSNLKLFHRQASSHQRSASAFSASSAAPKQQQ